MHIESRLLVLQEFGVIEGILDEGKGAVLSVCRAVQNGLIDHCTGLSLLEAQLITSELILPEFHMYLDLEDAFKYNLVDEPMYKQLQDLNEASKCIQRPRYASEPLPAVAAVKDGAISERLALKIIEIQLATGGLRETYTGDSLSLERAFECGLIPQSLYIQILKRQNTWKDLIDPNTAEKVSLIQLLQRSIVHVETGLRLLAVKPGKDGSIAGTSGREVNILRAMHEGLIDRETKLRLLSAQLFSGGIPDPRTNCKLTVEEAVSEGLIDQSTASGVLSHQAQHGGIVNPKNGARLTVDEAVQCNLMSSRSALLVLERQKCFMGLLWPHSGKILTVSMSMQHEIITENLAHELLCNRHKIAAFYIPENSKVIDIDSAAQNGLINACTVDILKTIEIPDMFPDVHDISDRFSSWLVMRELQIEGSERSREGLEANEKSINAPTSLEAKQLFLSFLMMNSYMDPEVGQRVLIFDSQFNKIAKVLLEMSETDRHINIYDSFQDEAFPDDEHITHTGDLAVLHIDEPLLRVAEESISEFSLEGEPCIKTSNIESDSGIYKASASEIKTNKSVPEDTFTCTKYHTNKTVNALVQPFVGTDILQTLSPGIVNQTHFLSEVEKNATLNHREKSVGEEGEDPAQCSVLCSKKAKGFALLTECTHCEDVIENKLERDHVLRLLKDHVNEGGILDVASGKRYNLDNAFDKGLIDEETILEVLALQLGRHGVIRNKTKTMSVLKQAVSQSNISSHLALRIMQQQNVLSGFYDSSGKRISAREAWEMGLITDDISSLILDSELAQKATTDPHAGCVYNVSKAKTVCDKEANNDEDFSEKCPSTENTVNRSEEDTRLSTNSKQMTSSLDSSFILNAVSSKVIAEEIGSTCTSTETLLATAAQMTIGLDLTFLLKTLGDNEIIAQEKGSVEISTVDFSEKCPITENAGKMAEELTNSNQVASSLASSFALNAVSYKGITDEEFAENSPSTENTMKRPDELTSTELPNNLDSLFTEKIVSDEEIVAEEFVEKCPSTEHGLIRTAKSNALLTDLTQFTSSSASSLKSVTGEGIIDEKFDEKCLNTENKVKRTGKVSNLLATQSREMSDISDTSNILKTVSGDFSDEGLNTKTQMNTLEEDNYLSANSTQINSSWDTACTFYEELGGKWSSTECSIKRPDDTHLSTNSKLITSGLDSTFLLKTDSDVEMTALEKESFEMPVVDFSEKWPSNTVNRPEDTHLSSNSKQMVSRLDMLLSLNAVSDAITAEKFGEQSPSTETVIKKSDEVSHRLTSSAQLTSTLDSSFTSNTTVDKITAGEFEGKWLRIENKVERSEEDTHPLRNPTPVPSSLDSSFLLTTAGDDVTTEGIGEKYRSTETEIKRTEQNNPLFTNSVQVTSILNSTLLLPKDSDEINTEQCLSTGSSLASLFFFKITNEDLAEKCPNAENTVRSTSEVSRVLTTAAQCRDTENELKTSEEAAKTKEDTYSLDSSFTLKTAEIPTTEQRPEKDTPLLLSSGLESSFSLKTVPKEIADGTFGEKSPCTENSLKTSEGTPVSTNLTEMTSNLDNYEICAEDLSNKCPSTENTQEAINLSIDTAQAMDGLDSTFTQKNNSDIEIHAESCPKSENAVNRTQEATPWLTSSIQMMSTLDSFNLNAEESTDDVFGENGSSENAVRTSDEVSLSTHLPQKTRDLDSSLTFMTRSDEIPAEDLSKTCSSTENAVNGKENASPVLTTLAKMMGSLDSSFSLKTDSKVTDDAFGKKCASTENAVRTSDEAFLSTNVTQRASSLDSSFNVMTNSDEIPAEDFSKKCPSTESTVNRTEEATPLLPASAQMISTLDSSLTLKTDSEETTDDVFGKKCPSTEIAGWTSDEASLSTNLTQMTSRLDSSFTFMTDNNKRQITVNAVNRTEPPLMTLTQINSSLDSFTLKPFSDEITGEEDTSLSSSTQMACCLDSSLKTVSEEITDKLLYDKCPNTETEVKRRKETNCLSGNTENAVNRTEEATPLLNNLTQMISSLDPSVVSEAIADKELGEECPCSENFVKRTEVTIHAVTVTTPLSSLNTTLLLKTGDIPSAIGFDPRNQDEIERIIHTHGLEDVDHLDCLDNEYSGDRSHAESEHVPEKENNHDEIYFNIAFNALCQAPFTCDRDVTFNKAAVNQRRSSVQRDSGIPCSLLSDIYSDERKSESIVNIHKQHSAFNEPQQTASFDRSSERINAVENIKTLMDSKSSVSSSTLIQLLDTRAAGKISLSPDSSENLQDRGDSVLSQPVDCFIQTNTNEKNSNRCTISKTSAIVEGPEHKCRSGTVNDHTTFNAVETQSSHFDLVGVNTSESLYMSKLCCADAPKTSPTLKFLPDVTLSDDSNNKQHLAKQFGAPDAAIDSNLPSSGFVISEKNKYDTGTLEYKTAITPAHIVGEQSLKSATSKSTVPPNSSDKVLLKVHMSQDSNSNGDELCAKSSVTESGFPPVYLYELEKTAVKGAVNEIQSKEWQALDNSERISPTPATHHDSNVIRVPVERKDPGLLKNLSEHEGIVPGCVNPEKCPFDVTGHGLAPSSLVLMQLQLSKMIQEMSADKEPETLKEILSVLGITAQGDQGSCMEGIEARPKAAATDGCDDDVFQSTLSNQQLSKANGSSMEEVKDIKVNPRVSI